MENNGIEETLAVCSYCDEEIRGQVYFTRSDEPICEQCFDENFQECANCGNCYDKDDMTQNEDGTYYCDDCYNEIYTTCYDCDCELERERAYVDDNGNDYCEECYCERYTHCQECGDEILQDEAFIYNDEYYCESCYDDIVNERENRPIENSTDRTSFGLAYQTNVGSYHWFGDWIKLKLPSEENPKYYFGFELEIDNDTNDHENDIFKYLKDTQNPLGLIAERDSSLSLCGVELISQPMTPKYFKAQENWLKEFLKFLQSLGYKSHDSGHCGLHFHFSKPTDDIEKKIMFIFETYKDEIKKVSRRVNSSYCAYASDNRNDLELKFKALDCYDKDNLKGYYQGHGMALNNANANTIEFRIMRGTLKYNSFMASYELVRNLYEECHKRKPVSKITWDILTKTRYIKEYITEHNIYSSIVPKDFSFQIKLEEARLEKLKKQLNKVIFTTMREVKTELNKTKISNDIYKIEKLANTLSMLNMYTSYTFTSTGQLRATINSIITSIKNYNRDFQLNTSYARLENLLEGSEV